MVTTSAGPDSAAKDQAGQAQAGSHGRLLLLDGHSLAYRAFFALPPDLATTTGQPTNAVYGFTSMLIKMLQDEQPTHVAVAFDRSEPTFRHEQYVEYKANRKETPGDLRSQFGLIFEVLDALGIAHLSVPGYEADDIIATLASQAVDAGMDVLIVTGDRDVLQLVNPHVTALMTRRGITEMTRFTPEEVVAKYGLTPAQYPDFAAIRGDPSDNLPNIPGVGEKTAAKWIADFGSLAQLVDRVDEVKGKAGDKLREHLGDVLRNRQLTELARDVPLEAGPLDLRPKPWDREQIYELFDTLQFRMLRDRLYSTLPDGIGGSAAAGRRAGHRRPWQASTWRSPGPAPMRWRSGWTSTGPAPSGPAWPCGAAGDAAPARCPRWPSRPPTAPVPTSTRWP